MESETVLNVSLSFSHPEALSVRLVKGSSRRRDRVYVPLLPRVSPPAWARRCRDGCRMMAFPRRQQLSAVSARRPYSTRLPVSPVTSYLYYFPAPPSPHPASLFIILRPRDTSYSSLSISLLSGGTRCPGLSRYWLRPAIAPRSHGPR